MGGGRRRPARNRNRRREGCGGAPGQPKQLHPALDLASACHHVPCGRWVSPLEQRGGRPPGPGHRQSATATPPASERACAHGTTASVFNKTLCRLASDSHEVLLLPVARPYCEPTVAHCRFAPRPKSVAATSPRTFAPALLDLSLLGPFRGTVQPFVTLVVR